LFVAAFAGADLAVAPIVHCPAVLLVTLGCHIAIAMAEKVARFAARIEKVPRNFRLLLDRSSHLNFIRGLFESFEMW
jgi:hypothetical protein